MAPTSRTLRETLDKLILPYVRMITRSFNDEATTLRESLQGSISDEARGVRDALRESLGDETKEVRDSLRESLSDEARGVRETCWARSPTSREPSKRA